MSSVSNGKQADSALPTKALARLSITSRSSYAFKQSAKCNRVLGTAKGSIQAGKILRGVSQAPPQQKATNCVGPAPPAKHNQLS